MAAWDSMHHFAKEGRLSDDKEVLCRIVFLKAITSDAILLQRKKNVMKCSYCKVLCVKASSYCAQCKFNVKYECKTFAEPGQSPEQP